MSNNRLFDLLPRVVQDKDTPGGQLKLVLDRFSEVIAEIERGIDSGYQDAFVETCDPWMLPYIADLIKARSFSAHSLGPQDVGTARSLRGWRSHIAHTIRMRKQKGTLGALRDVVHSLTGGHTTVFENGRCIVATPSIRHAGVHVGQGTPDLRRLTGLARRDQGPGLVPRVANVRRIDSHGEGGRWHPYDIVVEAWIRRAYLIDRAEPWCGPKYFTFSPLGIDTQLYASATGTLSEVVTSARAIRLIDFDATGFAKDAFYGPNKAICLFERGEGAQPVPVLSDAVEFVPVASNTRHSRLWKIDPENGRIKPPAQYDGSLLVRYYYAFGGDIGGGAYRDGPVGSFPKSNTASFMLSLEEAFMLSLKEAEDASSLVVPLNDSGIHAWPTFFPHQTPPALKTITLVAGRNCKPVIRAEGPVDLSILSPSKEITLDGVTVAGTSLDIPSSVKSLVLRDVTLANTTEKPHATGMMIVCHSDLTVIIERSIVGAFHCTGAAKATLTISDSIVHVPPGVAVLSGAIKTSMRNCTLLQDGVPMLLQGGAEKPEMYFCLQPEADQPLPAIRSRLFGSDGYCELVHGMPSEAAEAGAFRSTSQSWFSRIAREQLCEFVPIESRVGMILRD